MNITLRIIILVIAVLGLHSCKNLGNTHKTSLTNTGVQKELIINNRVSVPISGGYDKIWYDQQSIIISHADASTVYRSIDKKEVEFIGSEKLPYQFFSHVFNKPDSEIEKRFLEGFTGKVKRSNSQKNNLEFYFLNNKDGEQIYILSTSLDFVVEVTIKGTNKKYVDELINYSYLK